MLRLSGGRISQFLCSGYGMTAAQVADVIRRRFAMVVVAPDSARSDVCRGPSTPTPRSRDRARLQAQAAPGGQRHLGARYPSVQRTKTKDWKDASMIGTGPDLENTKRRLVEAADALRRLSMNGLKPSRLRSQWPDVIHCIEEAYGWTSGPMRPPRPSPGEITRMDEAIGWLLWLNVDERKVVWARSMRLSWRRIEDMDGRSIRTLQNIHAAALRRILSQRTHI